MSVSICLRHMYGVLSTEDAEVTARPPAGTKKMFNHEEHEGHEEGYRRILSFIQHHVGWRHCTAHSSRHLPVWPKAKTLHVLHDLHGKLSGFFIARVKGLLTETRRGYRRSFLFSFLRVFVPP